MTDANLLSQASLVGTDILGSKEISAEYCKLIRHAAAEGIVLLKNDGTLPLANQSLSVFGRVQQDYFYVGNGSGGDVNPPYLVNLIQGMDNAQIKYNKELANTYLDWCTKNPVEKTSEWGKWPTSYDEMPISKECAAKAKALANTAVIVIGRCAGEDRDSILEEGSFYLTKKELELLDTITNTFDKTIVIINSGNIIDFSWYKKYESKISALLYVWQGGMESGNAICDVLSGSVNPSGKLPTAIAAKYEDYPSSSNFGNKDFNHYIEDIYVGYRYFETFAKDLVLFPFGYGLSYTKFEISNGSVVEDKGTVSIRVNVKNTGNNEGAEVVQIYYAAPQGLLGKPLRALAAFKKTAKLKPSSTETMEISFSINQMASYDDAGKTGFKSAYVLEAGEYEIYVGNCVRSAVKIGGIIKELTMCCQHEEVAAVPASTVFKRIIAKKDAGGNIIKETENVPTRTVSLKKRILDNMPKEIPQTKELHHLSDVKSGKISLETFVATLSMEELEALTRGDYIMDSPLGASGNAGVFGGLTESLRQKGVAPITTTDGPAGIRLKSYCALLPCGLALASTWNLKLINDLATENGKELTAKGSNVLLGPGMNILRDPLCGRNFEYFSEDPYLSGKMAAATVNGIQLSGNSACPKHYVANNQEQFRIINDSRLSERALREIYLKGFEICVKESQPHTLMTSYNKINGVWGHYHYELCTTVLREEWGFKGNVVTDWWMRPSQDPDFPNVYNDGYRVRAQVDVLMPGSKEHSGTEGDNSLLDSYSKENGISLAEIQRCAMNTLRLVMKLK